MMSSKLAPIVLFVYNRPEHTRQTVEALARNTLAAESDLYIFSDGAKSKVEMDQVGLVRNYIVSLKEKSWFKSIKINMAPKNMGLADSIINGVDSVIKRRGKVIVLEDDLVTAPDFLIFLNQCLVYYEKNLNIGSISGYSPIPFLVQKYSEDVYISGRNSSLGWGTWKDRWETVDWSCEAYSEFSSNVKMQFKFGEYGMDRVKRLHRQMCSNNTSWSIKFGFWQFNANKQTIYPTISRLKHIGWDGSGTHSKDSHRYCDFNSQIEEKSQPFQLILPVGNDMIKHSFRVIYSGSFFQQCKYKIFIILHRIFPTIV